MKRGFLLIIAFALLVASVYAEEAWREDAKRGDDYFHAGDYDVAWLFYQRALSKGCDDGVVLFQTAESFRLQTLADYPGEENSDLEHRLYAVARYFLENQYPDSPAMKSTANHVTDGTVVNRRFLRKTYALAGGKFPKKTVGVYRTIVTETDAVRFFFISRIEILRDFFAIVMSGDINEISIWTRFNSWNLLFSFLLLSSFTGIILPVAMAVRAAREGRKSYFTAYAFLFHWGILGIHRFYIGRRVSGIIWLFTGGLSGIGVFFDLFLTRIHIRSWNEDHLHETPGKRSDFTGRIQQSTMKNEAFPEVPEDAGRAKMMQPIPMGTVADSPDEKVEGSGRSEEFSFGEKSESSVPATVQNTDVEEENLVSMPENDASATMPDSELEFNLDNNFGDLSELSFEDEAIDDFSIPAELSDDAEKTLRSEEPELESHTQDFSMTRS